MNGLRVCAVALIASAVITFCKDAFFVKLTDSSILNNVAFIKNIFNYISPVGLFIFALSLFLKKIRVAGRTVPIIAIILIAAVIGVILY